MALQLPIEIPQGLMFNSKVFDLGRYQSISPGGAGFIQTVERAEPLWFAEYNSIPLNDSRYAEMSAFRDFLEGATESFLGYDPRRQMPLAYASLPITADPWTQVGQVAPRVTAMDFAASTLSLDRMAVGAIVSPSDYISLNVGKIWYLWRVQTGGTVGGPGTIDLVVKPRPHLFSGALGNVVINGDGTSGVTTGWFATGARFGGNNDGILTIVSGQLHLAIQTFAATYTQQITTVPGATYTVTANKTAGARFTVGSADNFAGGLLDLFDSNVVGQTAGTLVNGTFVAPGTTAFVSFGTNGLAAIDVDNIVVQLRPLVRYRRACCQMKVIGGFKEEDSVDTFPKVSFKAFQFIDRSSG